MFSSLDLDKKILMIYISEMVTLILLLILSIIFLPSNDGMLGLYSYCIISVIYFAYKIVGANDLGIMFYSLGILIISSTLFHFNINTFPMFFCAVLPVTRLNKRYLRFLACSLIILSAVLQAVYLNIFNGYIAVFVLGVITTLIIETAYIHQIKQKNDLVLGAEKADHLAKVAERERVAEDLSDDLLGFFDTIDELSNQSIKSINRHSNEAEANIKSIQTLTRETLSKVRRIVVDYRQGTVQRTLQDSNNLLSEHGIKLEINLDITPIRPEIERHLSGIISDVFNILIFIPECSNIKLKISSSHNRILCTFNTNGIINRTSKIHKKIDTLKENNNPVDFTLHSSDLLRLNVVLPIN